jgi:hypothetical protein
MSGLKLLLAAVLPLILFSCSALQNVFQSKKTTQGYLTFNIFLSPESLSFKKVHVIVRNSTIYKELEVEKLIKQNFEEKKYIMTPSPDQAEIVINANIRYYGIFEREILNAMLEDKSKKEGTAVSGQDFTDFSGVLKPSRYNVDFSGLVMGAAGGFSLFSTLTAAMIGGVAVGGAGIALEGFFAPQIILAFVDVTISEKLPFIVKQHHFNQVGDGEGGSKKIEYEAATSFKNLQTQIIVVSRSSSLTDKKALSDTKKQIVASLTGLL